jgi:class 3 adenylate cyclase/tetratricopeptide (TPR) repeat protein
VTVLFADLVGFTARSEVLDPEDVEAILRPYHERLRGELERFGGTVEKFIGDAVVALFGAPVAREDDPERGVRAAIAIRDWAREEGEVQVRIGVNTGEALINLGARPESGEGMAAGDVVNTTSRLQSQAPINGVLVGETTFRATRGVIDYREADAVEAKGKTDPVPVWEALAARSRVTTEAVSAASPLVGRERELSVLSELLVRVREESSPQLVTLVGVPGIGKSRLVYELMQVVDRGGVLTYWRRGRSLPYGEAVPLWSLSEVVKAQAGILESDRAADVERKLRDEVSRLIPDERDASWVTSNLLPLVGVAAEDAAGGDRRSEAFAAWRRFFEGMAEHRPLVLVFEDLHWADDELLDFVDHLVEWASGVPILIVCTARPELLERRFAWGGGKLNATTLSLAPLSETDTSRLLANLLDRPLLAAETQADLLARAGGNPLYAEQYAQMLLEGSDDAVLPMPESIQGVIAARIDRLSPKEKALLQDAAVLGKVFWLGGVVDGRSLRDADAALHALDRKGFVRRARTSSVADETEYTFLHILVRDVAYAQIPRGERAEKHQRAAVWIESLGRPEDHAETLAYHYVSALELARSSRQPTEELAERARLVLREAGDRAASLNAFDAAARSYASALELWPPDDVERPLLLLSYGTVLAIGREAGGPELEQAARDLVELGDDEHAAQAEILLADIDWRAGKRDEADIHMARAVALVRDIPASPAKASVLSEVSRYHMLGDRDREAIESGLQAFDMATQLELDVVRAHALNNIGTSRVHAGDAKGGIGDLERSIEISNEIGSPESLRAYNNLFSCYTIIGELDSAAEAIGRGLPVAERFGNVGPSARWLRFERLHIANWQGRWDACTKLIDEVLGDVGPTHALSRWAFEVRGRIRLARDDVAGAVEDAKRSLELGRLAKDPQTFWPALSFAGIAFLEARQKHQAEALADELLDLDPTEHPMPHYAMLFDLAWLMIGLNRRHELAQATKQAPIRTPWIDAAEAIADGAYGEAADIYARTGARPLEAYTRLRAAAELVDAARRTEADAQLHRALAFWRSVDATRYLRDGEALLAATG